MKDFVLAIFEEVSETTTYYLIPMQELEKDKDDLYLYSVNSKFINLNASEEQEEIINNFFIPYDKEGNAAIPLVTQMGAMPISIDDLSDLHLCDTHIVKIVHTGIIL